MASSGTTRKDPEFPRTASGPEVGVRASQRIGPAYPGESLSYTTNAKEITLTDAASLTTAEQITLRRLAYGQSDPASLSQQDLRRLRELGLINGPERAPAMTASGQRYFHSLSRPATPRQADLEPVLADMLRRLRHRPQ